MKRAWIALLAVSLLALLALLAAGVRHIPEGELGIAHGSRAVRKLPPGWHLINPLRDALQRIPTQGFEVRGMASVATADGYTVRLPFTARVSLMPRVFAPVLGENGGIDAAESVRRGLEAGLATWGASRGAVEFLVENLSEAAGAAVAQAAEPLGIRVETLDLQRPDPDIYLFLAEDALSRRDPIHGADLIEEALIASPEDARLWAARGMLLEASNSWAAAEGHYLRALQLSPGLEAALARLFVGWKARGEVGRLEERLLAGLAAHPDSLKIRNWLALVYLDQERFAEALEQLERAREQGPRHEPTLTNLGGLYQRIGRPDDAAEVYRLALEDHPDDQRLLFNLGLAELARGDLPAARKALEDARAAGLPWVSLLNAMAEVYRRSGLKDEAREVLLASYELDPDQPGLREALTGILGHPPD